MSPALVRPALAMAVTLLLGACSADLGPPETSAADAPVRATTTTAPPPPTLERVVVEARVLGGPGDQRMLAVAAGASLSREERVVAVGQADGRPAAWWSPDGRAWQRADLDPGQFGEAAAFADVAADPVSGGWVAVGAEEGRAAAWASLDGVTWERAEVDRGPAMTTVGASRYGLIAFGTGSTGDPGRDGGEETVAWQSLSGRQWVRAVDDPDLFTRPGAERVVAVADTGAEVLAVVEREGQGPEVWRSTEGLFWSPAPAVGTDLLPAEGRPGAGAAVALGSTLVVVGTDTKADGTDAAMWVSTGAQSIRQVAHDEAVLGGDGAQAMAALARNGDQLVMVGTETDDGGDVDAVVWSSALGSSLQRVDDDGLAVAGDQHALDVTVSGSTPVAVGWEESPGGADAVVWVVAPAAVDEAEEPNEAAPPPGPALNWERVAAGDDWSGPGEQRMDALAVTANGFLAVGSVRGADGADAADGAMWRSIDGQEWSRPSDMGAFAGPGDQGLADVATAPEAVVAVGFDGTSAAVWASTDGESWLRVAHDEGVFGGPGDQRMEAVMAPAGAEGWVAVGSDTGTGSQDAAVWRSPDGLTWSRVRDDDALAGPGDQRLADVATGPAGLVAVGVDGETASAWTSGDALTWSRTGIGPGRASGLAAGSGGGLVAVGSAVGEGLDAAVWRSADGLEWSRVGADDLGGPLDQELTAVSVGEELSVAVGRTSRGGGDDAAASASGDGGATWLRAAHAEHVFGGDQAQRMLDVATWEGLVVAVGHTGSTPDARDGAVWVANLAGGGGRTDL